jgi:predicted metal-dependent phosphoesterase TrpH
MIIELHCHTIRSFDAFTTENELLNACIVHGIDVVAITEHDRIAVFNGDLFRKHNITVIPGCEFTTDLGAHIIGLFVNKTIKKGSTALEIINHIKDEDGLILIPHPFKDTSGVCAVYKEHSFILEDSHMIELYNGGQKETNEQVSKIKKLARSFTLQMVAASDAHKVNQIGYYVTTIAGRSKGDLKDQLMNGNFELAFNSNYSKRPREINKIQSSTLYQSVIKLLPYYLKHSIKLMYYKIIGSRYTFIQANYQKLKE